MIAEERETVINTTDADDLVRVWTCQARYLGRLRRQPSFTEVKSGRYGSTEWAEFTIQASEWNPASGAKRRVTLTEEQRQARAARLPGKGSLLPKIPQQEAEQRNEPPPPYRGTPRRGSRRKACTQSHRNTESGHVRVTVQTVHFDRPLRQLDQIDAEAWKAWLLQHTLDHMSIACPSQLIYRSATKTKPPSVTVELLGRDSGGSFRSKRGVEFSGPLLAFPAGYRVEAMNSRAMSV
jgi:hypothetical protein